MKFISKDENYPDREINGTIVDYAWNDNTHFVYNSGGERDLSMDLENGYISEVLEDNYLENIKNRKREDLVERRLYDNIKEYYKKSCYIYNIDIYIVVIYLYAFCKC